MAVNRAFFDAFSLSQILPSQTAKQLEFLNQAQEYMNYVIAGILLQYYSLTLQKDILICSAVNPESSSDYYPDPFQFQAAASLLVLYALFGFYGQTKEVAKEACEAGTDLSDAKSELVLNETAIAVSLIRFVRLLKQNSEIQDDTSVVGEELQEEDLDLF